MIETIVNRLPIRLRRLVASLPGSAPVRLDTHMDTQAMSVLESNAAAAMWDARDDLVFEVDWREDEANHGRYSYHIPDIAIVLPDGRRIVMKLSKTTSTWGTPIVDHPRRMWQADVDLCSSNGQTEGVGMSHIINRTWRAVAAMRLARRFGHHLLASRIRADDEQAMDTVLRALIEDTAPTTCTETYLHQPLVTSWTGERPPNPPPFRLKTPWMTMGEDLMLRTYAAGHYLKRDRDRQQRDIYQSAPVALVSHPDIGMVILHGADVEATIEARRQRSIGEAFGGEVPRRIVPPAGNARAAQIITLAARAIELDPEMSDGSGTPIAPLVAKHVPRLLEAHAAAMETATAQSAAGIDMDLDEGLEIVRAAVEEGLSRRARDDHDALRTELEFLRLRHPPATRKPTPPG